MRTQAISTSISAFHDHRASGKSSQQRARILALIEQRGGDWSIGEIAQALGMEKSTISARVNELLYETGDVIAKPNRPDRVSGVCIRPVGLPLKQLDLLQ